jgi:hypothetical protein
MSHSTPDVLRFPPVAGLTVRAEFDGGALSSDFGPLILRGIDQQIGLIDRLVDAVNDRRHPSYIDHSLRDLFTQRIFQIACGYADGNDANTLRTDPLFKLGLNRHPLVEAMDLASGPTFSRLENAVSSPDLYRLAQAFVDQFIASYAQPPKVIVLDLDHSEDPTHGQQAFSFYNHYYRHHCYLPLLIFEGLSGKFITAALRTGKRPTGAENAMILKRVLERLRTAWPETRIILRGDSHFANPELMQLALDDPAIDFIFGLAGNCALSPRAEPFLVPHRCRFENARRSGLPLTTASHTYHEIAYQAATWPHAFRVILKAEVTTGGDNPRFIVTSLDLPTPMCLYRDLYSARGQDENFIKMLKNDLASDRTSDHRFQANHLRLFFSCAAYVLHQALRTEILVHTELAKAQPITVMLKLFKLAVRVVAYKDRIKLHLPTSFPFKDLLRRVTDLLFLTPPPPPLPA